MGKGDCGCRSRFIDAVVALLGLHALNAKEAGTKHTLNQGDLTYLRIYCVMELMKSKDELYQKCCERICRKFKIIYFNKKPFFRLVPWYNWQRSSQKIYPGHWFEGQCVRK